MADALVSAVVRTILGNLNSTVLQEIGVLWGLKDELNRLESTFCTLQLVLHDAELRGRKTEAVYNWQRKLKDAACDAENILDVIATEGLRRRANSVRGMHCQFKSLVSLKNPLLFRWKMAQEVRNIREKIDAIAEERRKFHLGESVVESRFGVTLESRHTTSLVDESEIYGRHDEKEVIMEKLMDGTCDQQGDPISVYVIQGMGGLGKTTLAQMVYNDGRTEKHFDLRIWVCVSDDFSTQKVVKAILESIEGGGCIIFELDPLVRRLQERLTKRRFLLVLDDIWNENQRLWDELKEVLRCGLRGSVLMITTRIEKAAFMMSTIPVHHVKFLSEDDSWSLFKQRAFINGEGEESFIAIGKAIMKKCEGVPLAIKALGGLMRFKSDEREWLAIKESELWHLSDEENVILPALRLSYDNLLPHMRQCFAYCSTFPKGYWMEENQLIGLWMANGYIPCDNLTDMHLSGCLIIRELIWRSFLQNAGTDCRGNMNYKMHDLMQDLASSVTKLETYIIGREEELSIPKTLRHLCFKLWPPQDVLANKSSMVKLPITDSLRSIIVHHGSYGPSWMKCFHSLLLKQQYLRVMDSHWFYTKQLPDVVCKLKHLRYLAMACDNIKRLPESLTRLYNLQTLKLMNSRMLLELPKNMKVMKNLWVLDIENSCSLVCTPPGLGDLIYLHTLTIFIVGQDASQQIDQLKNLNLCGKLSIQGLDNVRNLEDAGSANLLAKTGLTSLCLHWNKGIKDKSAEHFEEVLQGLQPHHNLEKICLSSYHGSKFPNWMSTSVLRKLKIISLVDCPRCQKLPPFGKLSSLTCLSINEMECVTCFDSECYKDEECSFPALTKLSISRMPNLEEWAVPNSAESFPCLEELKIEFCAKLIVLPKLPTLRSLNICGCGINASLLRSMTFLTSLTSLIIFSSPGWDSKYSFTELDELPGGFLQNHKALEVLEMLSLPIQASSDVLDNLSALKTLRLKGCVNLEVLPEGLKYLTSLERLTFDDCQALVSFPAALLESLPSLISLSLLSCKKLKALSGPLKQVAPLQDLFIYDLPELEHLPESMQLLGALARLHICACERLSSFPNWLGTLASLTSIRIEGCLDLKSLPDGFRSLKSLRELYIHASPELGRRCKKSKGRDWPNISHIPIIIINGKDIQRLHH